MPRSVRCTLSSTAHRGRDGRGSTSHILIVEDDAKLRLLLRRCFEGYRVADAASGVEGVFHQSRWAPVTLLARPTRDA